MENSSFSTEIISLEKKFWTAMQNHDLQTALSLTDFPCVVAGANGLSAVNKEEFEKMFNSNEGAIRDFKFDENSLEVRELSPDAAVVAYKVHTTFTKNGESRSIDAIDTSTWIKKDNKWVCAMHTETELPRQ